MTIQRWTPDDNTTEVITPKTHLAESITGPVVVPFLQAAITGVLMGIFLGVLAGVLRGWGADWVNPWVVAVLAWTGGTMYSWLHYRARWQYVVESILGVDLNRDGFIGPPPVYQPEPVRVELIRNGGQNVDYIDVPYYQEVKTLAPQLVRGVRTFSLDGVTPILGRTEFVQVRDVFLTRGLARWKNPKSVNQGVELTHAGRAVLRRMAGESGDVPPTRTPPAKFYVQPGEDPETD